MYKTYNIVPVNYNTYDCVYFKPRRTISSPFYYPLAVTGGYIKKESGGCCTSTEKYTYQPVTYGTYGYGYVPQSYYYPYYLTSRRYVPEYQYTENYYKVKGNHDKKKKEKYEYEDRDKYICSECSAKGPHYIPERAIFIPPTVIVP